MNFIKNLWSIVLKALQLYCRRLKATIIVALFQTRNDANCKMYSTFRASLTAGAKLRTTITFKLHYRRAFSDYQMTRGKKYPRFVRQLERLVRLRFADLLFKNIVVSKR
jgi:hypothetical protein